jgi:predicted Fe-Mo cluster-binding NifX family protein
VYVNINLRFRWASMQLQNLCSFRIEADLQKALGRLPPGLYTLYDEIYDVASTAPGELEAMVFKNVLCLLLCAQRTLRTGEFLAVVSVDLRRKTGMISISKDLVLDICNNFVIFDSELDTFRFAHLSVREFLEKRPEHNTPTSNTLIAEICLWSVLSTDSDSATDDLLRQAGLQAKPVLTQYSLLSAYTDVYWATHCKLAGENRGSGALKLLLQHFLNATLSLTRWSHRLEAHLHSDVNRWIMSQLYGAIRSNETPASGLFVCCVFDFDEQIEVILEGKPPGMLYMNSHGQSHLQVAASNGCCATLERLIARYCSNAQIPVEVVIVAAGNYRNGKEVMALLLDRQGADIPITEEVVKAAAGNYNGKEVMALLLDRRGVDVVITEEVVMVAAGNDINGKEVMALLLDRRGADIPITEEVVKAAAGNYNGKEVMALLLDRRGVDVVITEEVVKAAADKHNGKEVMALLLNRRGVDVPITEKAIAMVVQNFGKAIVALLFNQQEANVVITEEVVKAAAGNDSNGKEVIALLLDQRGADVVITKEVVKAAIDNYGNGKEVITLLFEQRETEVYEALKRNNRGNSIESLGKHLFRVRARGGWVYFRRTIV